MTWEYLDNRNDGRLRIIAEYLKGKTKGKFIVDLDCLEGRMLNYLDHDYMSYKGNDLIVDRWVGGYKATIKQQTSKDFVRTLKQCDILLVLGYTDAGDNISPLEDHDLTNSVKYVVGELEPKVVVIETWYDYNDANRRLSEWCINLGYKISRQVEIPEINENRMLHRYLTILEK